MNFFLELWKTDITGFILVVTSLFIGLILTLPVIIIKTISLFKKINALFYIFGTMFIAATYCHINIDSPYKELIIIFIIMAVLCVILKIKDIE